MSSRRIDITGLNVGFLTAVRSTGQGSPYGILWDCQCDCGKVVQRAAGMFRAEKYPSCGRLCPLSRAARRKYDYAAIAALAAAGKTRQEIMALVGCSRLWLATILKAAGVQPRRQPCRKPTPMDAGRLGRLGPTARKIYDLAIVGRGCTEIASDLGCTRENVRQTLNRLLPDRPPPKRRGQPRKPRSVVS